MLLLPIIEELFLIIRSKIELSLSNCILIFIRLTHPISDSLVALRLQIHPLLNKIMLYIVSDLLK